MERVVNEIEKQSRYLFLFNKDIDSQRITVSVNAENQIITQILPELFKNTGLDYTIEGTTILVTRTTRALDNVPVLIRGKVKDSKGSPIVGASVIVKGTTVGVSTDTDGMFSLQVPPPVASAMLEINYLGYELVVMPVGSRTDFNITMHESAAEIEQVIITALGIKRSEKALAYTVAQVAPEDVTMVKDANFVNALSGKVAGAVINPSSSGVGGVSKVVMRGMKLMVFRCSTTRRKAAWSSTRKVPRNPSPT